MGCGKTASIKYLHEATVLETYMALLLKVRPHYNPDSIRIQSRSTETRFNSHQSRPHYTTVCGLSTQVLGTRTNSRSSDCPQICPNVNACSIDLPPMNCEAFLRRGNRLYIHCKPVTAADLDQAAGLLVGATLQAIAPTQIRAGS